MHHPPTGWLFIDLPGLPEATLRAALAGGDAPALAALLDAGHRLEAWEPDLAGGPAVGLAGLLHGDNFDIPAAAWYDRVARRTLAPAVRVADAAVVEARVDRGLGLLRGGTARGALLRGGASGWSPGGGDDPVALGAEDLATYVPAVYVALHESGVEGEPVGGAVRTLDREAGRLVGIARARGYEVVVLSSHAVAAAEPDVPLGREIAAAVYAADPGALVHTEGGLAFVTFPARHRLTREELDEHFPGLLARLASLPGVAFALVNASVAGATVLGPDGAVSLDEERHRGADPLAAYGPGCARHLRRLNLFRSAPDILVASAPDGGLPRALDGRRTAGGTLGGTAALPFLLAPSGAAPIRARQAATGACLVGLWLRELRWPQAAVVGVHAG